MGVTGRQDGLAVVQMPRASEFGGAAQQTLFPKTGVGPLRPPRRGTRRPCSGSKWGQKNGRCAIRKGGGCRFAPNTNLAFWGGSTTSKKKQDSDASPTQTALDDGRRRGTRHAVCLSRVVHPASWPHAAAKKGRSRLAGRPPNPAHRSPTATQPSSSTPTSPVPAGAAPAGPQLGGLAPCQGLRCLIPGTLRGTSPAGDRKGGAGSGRWQTVRPQVCPPCGGVGMGALACLERGIQRRRGGSKSGTNPRARATRAKKPPIKLAAQSLSVGGGTIKGASGMSPKPPTKLDPFFRQRAGKG